MKLLVLGAGVFQVPLIKKAKELGHTVITTDYLPNNPGHAFADYVEYVSTVEKEAVLTLARKYEIDGVITIASDVAVPTVAFVAEKLKLNGIPYTSAEIISHKHTLRDFMQKNDCRIPIFGVASKIEEAIPIFEKISSSAIIKPVDCSGSKGVVKVNNINELVNNFAFSLSFSRKKLVCIEQFLEGLEIGGDAIIINNQIEFIQLTNKFLTLPPYYVPIGHTIPSKLSPEIRETIYQEILKLVNALGINNSPINFDIILTDQGVYILEMGARIGGNCIPEIIKYGTGVDTIGIAIEMAMGHLPKFNFQDHVVPVGVRIFQAPKDGILYRYHDLEVLKKKFPGILDIAVDYQPNEPVNKFIQGNYRLGHVIYTDSSIEDVEKGLQEIEKGINIVVY